MTLRHFHTKNEQLFKQCSTDLICRYYCKMKVQLGIDDFHFCLGVMALDYFKNN